MVLLGSAQASWLHRASLWGSPWSCCCPSVCADPRGQQRGQSSSARPSGLAAFPGTPQKPVQGVHSISRGQCGLLATEMCGDVLQGHSRAALPAGLGWPVGWPGLALGRGLVQHRGGLCQSRYGSHVVIQARRGRGLLPRTPKQHLLRGLPNCGQMGHREQKPGPHHSGERRRQPGAEKVWGWQENG